MWYQALSNIKSGGYVYSYRGIKFVAAGNNYVLTSGTYEEPIAEMIIKFKSAEDMAIYYRRLKQYE